MGVIHLCNNHKMGCWWAIHFKGCTQRARGPPEPWRIRKHMKHVDFFPLGTHNYMDLYNYLKNMSSFMFLDFLQEYNGGYNMFEIISILGMKTKTVMIYFYFVHSFTNKKLFCFIFRTKELCNDHK